MNLSEECALSYYQPIAEISPEHGVILVQHQETGKLFVKKRLRVYNLEVFQFLQEPPIPNTPKIYELVEDGDVLIVIEEYLTGTSLQELLDQQGVLEEAQVADLTRQLCVILDQLHRADPPIIHRDIKPANLILSPDGVLKLLDMNAAKHASTGQTKDTVLIGTSGYAAPEQYGFGASSIETDLYSVGVLMNVLLTGLFPAESLAPGSLGAVIAKCTHMDPAERYHSAEELAAALPCSIPAPAASAPSNRFCLPGFRSGTLWKKLLASLGYFLILCFGLSLEVENATPLSLWLNRLFFTLALVEIVLFSCDYLNLRSSWPLTKGRHFLPRLLGTAVTDAAILLGNIVILVLLEGILF